MENLQNLVDECYRQFISNESIVGFNGLLKSKGLGSKRIIRLRNLIYEKYGKQKLVDIYRQRLAKLGGHSTLGHEVSKETKQKIRESNIDHWKENVDRRKLSRKLMLDNCVGKSQTPEVKKKRVVSRRKGGGWNPHSVESKEKMSQIFLQKWKNGDYNNRVKSFSSKGQLEVMSIVSSLGFDVEDEYLINGKPYDILVKGKNLIVEFNGTYWHLDPRRYDKDHYDKSRQMYAHEIWTRDLQKLDVAKKRGYNTVVVWEQDWNDCQDKVGYVKSLLC